MICEFTGTNRFLSNFWPAKVIWDGLLFETVEAAYQAAKVDVAFATDPIEVNRRIREIQMAGSPNEAKRLGRIPIPKIWHSMKIRVMKDLLRQKFEHGKLQCLLLATGNETIVEGNWWHDNDFGVCECKNCLGNGGENYLGRLLMEVREEKRAKVLTRS